ncbi:MAG: hypothetical protein EPN68_02610 [Rhodanobacter sp.]|nr:MAG: hypothetical protein EPN68_02610 [Rhodanobacter sp.]
MREPLDNGWRPLIRFVIPAQAGIQGRYGLNRPCRYWIPACAGMTNKSNEPTVFHGFFHGHQ